MPDATDDSPSGLERPLLLAMSLLYVGAGVMHFLTPKAFTRIVPPRLPRPLALVYLSGLAEVVLGVGVLFERTRRPSAWGLVALLVAVFPANVHMATNTVLPDSVPERGRGLARIALWLRLPLQAVLVAWAWRYTRPPSTDGE
jgi:uncharacterized membrane protein